MNLRTFAQRLERDPSVLSRWETGERTPAVDQVAKMLTLLDVSSDTYDEIISLTRGTYDSRWLAVTLPEQRQQLATLLDLEQTAARITTTSPLLVPGLLQTAGYIRGIMSVAVPANEVTTRVAVRIGRKEVLTRSEPVSLVAIVGEGALRQRIGTRQVMAEQMRHLLDMAKRANVEIRVLGYDTGWHPALEGPFNVLDPLPGEQNIAVVHLENRRSGLFLHEEDDVDTYRQAAEMVCSLAMSPKDSLGLIAELAERWETTE